MYNMFFCSCEFYDIYFNLFNLIVQKFEIVVIKIIVKKNQYSFYFVIFCRQDEDFLVEEVDR